MHGQSLIDMSIPSINQGQMVSFVMGKNPQGVPNQSMGSPYSHIQLSQGDIAYPRGNSIPQYQNRHVNPLYNTIPQRNFYITQPMYNIGSQTVGGVQVSSIHPSSPWSESGAPNNLPFLATDDIPNLYKLTNDPIYYNLQWLLISRKIPTNLPKLDGKQWEDPGSHITTYHLWCVSNSMVDDSVWLRIFPRTINGNAAKWYIELPCVLINTFDALGMKFLKNF